jgi:putative ABC transport system permease protein
VRFVGERQWRTVVGIAADVRAFDLTRSEPEWMKGTIYVPQSAAATLEDGRIPTALTLTVRTTLPPMRVSTLIREAVGRPDAVIGPARSMSSIVADAVAAPAATTTLLASMAGLAVTLGCIGVYGVLSFLVSRRVRDFGIRMALGARPSHVFWTVMREAAVLCAAGIAIGLAGAAVLTRWMSTELYGVSPTDPVTYAFVAVAIAVATFAASCLPTRRALRVDPLIVLREP